MRKLVSMDLKELMTVADQFGVKYMGTIDDTATAIFNIQGTILSNALQGVVGHLPFLNLMLSIVKKMERLAELVEVTVNRVDRFEVLLKRFEQDGTFRIRLESMGVLSPRDINILSREAIIFFADYYKVRTQNRHLPDIKKELIQVLQEEGWGEKALSEQDAFDYERKRALEEIILEDRAKLKLVP